MRAIKKNNAQQLKIRTESTLMSLDHIRLRTRITHTCIHNRVRVRVIMILIVSKEFMNYTFNYHCVIYAQYISRKSTNLADTISPNIILQEYTSASVQRDKINSNR